ncbi:hypothetical protein WJX72_007297 [[Myrmecia] bisecta]|uniref:D-serine dehydratase-like domain-containing protein n=1 Tax=[Myrmecia] bisecta TaxID=41462 RepID=A0AAW1PHQ5_9CHLO
MACSLWLSRASRLVRPLSVWHSGVDQLTTIVTRARQRTHAAQTQRSMSFSACRPPAEPGQTLDQVDTPALQVDLNAFDENCIRLKRIMDTEFPAVRVRPHAKAHKCPQLAQRQLGILGSRASGICCQKVGEAEALAAGGLRNILVSNEVVSPGKLRRLVALAAQGTRIALCVDNSVALASAAGIAAEAGTSLEVLVEVNVGQERCGVDTAEQVLQLAKQVQSSEGVSFGGIQAYQGALQHLRHSADRAAAVAKVVDKVKHVLGVLGAAGIQCPSVTGGGSGTFTEEAGSGVFTEVQPGSFAFGDADYRINEGWQSLWQQSLWLLATVMSRNVAAGRAVLDAGLKAASLDSGPPVLPAEATGGVPMQFLSGGDEHGVLLMPKEAAEEGRLPNLGELLRLIPGHVDPTMNQHDWLATCGWEEVYVCAIELVKSFIEAFHEHDSPATLNFTNGNYALWLRYGEWLLTCPVILIHLCNITGMHEEYSERTMTLLVSDVGCIVWGTTAAFTKGPLKVLFFALGCVYGAYTFYHAAQVYIESFHMVPRGLCRQLVKAMAWVYFTSWVMFPFLFIAGPEGFGVISIAGSVIGHTIADLLSKNTWGFIGHYLRYKIHEHILIHGDIRKKVHHTVLGKDEVIEEMVDEEDEETERHPTAGLANRESFIMMRDNLQKKGISVRASLDGSSARFDGNMANPYGNSNFAGVVGPNGGNYGNNFANNVNRKADNNGRLMDGRIVLGFAANESMVQFWQQQFSALPAHIEILPYKGLDAIMEAVVDNQAQYQAAVRSGQLTAVRPIDFVLLDPKYLGGSLVPKLQQMGVRVVAWGFDAMGGNRELFTSVDAYIEGPSFGSLFNVDKFKQIVYKMQQARQQAEMITAGGQQGQGQGMMMGNTTNFNNMGNDGNFNAQNNGYGMNANGPMSFPTSGSVTPNGMRSGQMTPNGMNQYNGGMGGDYQNNMNTARQSSLYGNQGLDAQGTANSDMMSNLMSQLSGMPGSPNQRQFR